MTRPARRYHPDVLKHPQFDPIALDLSRLASR